MTASFSHEVIANVTALLMSQQYDTVITKFNEWFVDLEDIFFAAELEREHYYELSCQLAVPMVPFQDAEQETATARFERFIGASKMAVENEIEKFEKSSQELRYKMEEMVREGERKWSKKERDRNDELFSVMNACRREVGATIALIKTESAQTDTEVHAMKSLRDTLDTTTEELKECRKQLRDLRARNEKDLSSQRMSVERELDALRATIAQERVEMAKRLQEALSVTSEERGNHWEEISKIGREHREVVDKMRVQLADRDAEIRALRDDVDTVRGELMCGAKEHSSDRAALLETIVILENRSGSSVSRDDRFGAFSKQTPVKRDSSLVDSSPSRRSVPRLSSVGKLTHLGTSPVAKMNEAAGHAAAAVEDYRQKSMERERSSPGLATSVRGGSAAENNRNPLLSARAAFGSSGRQASVSPGNDQSFRATASKFSLSHNTSRHVDDYASPIKPSHNETYSSSPPPSVGQQRSASIISSLRTPSETYLRLANLTTELKERSASRSPSSF